jgi:predicted N-acetyltransferase YhbS
MRTEVRPVAGLTADERDALQDLSAAVYPPEVSAVWPGRTFEWAAHDWCVVTWDADGRAVCYVGVVARDARSDGRPVRVGGIGGVKTRPAVRERGLATAAIRRAVEFLRDEPAAAFALLVCEPDLIPFYERPGWQPFPGVLLVAHHGATVPFAFNRPMTHPVWSAPPPGGTIDLLGPPW